MKKNITTLISRITDRERGEGEREGRERREREKGEREGREKREREKGERKGREKREREKGGGGEREKKIVIYKKETKGNKRMREQN